MVSLIGKRLKKLSVRMLNSPNDRDKRLADLWPIRLTLIRCVSLSRVHSSFLACHFRVSASGPLSSQWLQPEAERGEVQRISLLLEDAEPSFQSELSPPTVPASVKPH